MKKQITKRISAVVLTSLFVLLGCQNTISSSSEEEYQESNPNLGRCGYDISDDISEEESIICNAEIGI